MDVNARTHHALTAALAVAASSALLFGIWHGWWPLAVAGFALLLWAGVRAGTPYGPVERRVTSLPVTHRVTGRRGLLHHVEVRHGVEGGWVVPDGDDEPRWQPLDVLDVGRR